MQQLVASNSTQPADRTGHHIPNSRRNVTLPTHGRLRHHTQGFTTVAPSPGWASPRQGAHGFGQGGDKCPPGNGPLPPSQPPPFHSPAIMLVFRTSCSLDTSLYRSPLARPEAPPAPPPATPVAPLPAPDCNTGEEGDRGVKSGRGHVCHEKTAQPTQPQPHRQPTQN